MISGGRPGAHRRSDSAIASSESPSATPDWIVGLVGLTFGVVVAMRSLIPANMDPTVFLALGRDKPIQTSYAEERLGNVSVRPRAGHDGKFFFAQANDPFLLEPQLHAVVLDNPNYRARRMLYPTIAGGLGFFPPGVVVWAMLILNIVALGLGSFIAARLASSLGATPWLGLAVPLNVGLVYELEIDGAGVIAYVCCLAALAALMKDNRWMAASWLAAAALSREIMLGFAFGVFILLWKTERRYAWRLVVVPASVLSIWSAYTSIRLQGIPGTGGAPENFAPPFVGLFEAAGRWIGEPTALVLNSTVVLVVVTFTALALRSRLAIVWGALPFVGLSIVLSVNVWAEVFDFSRILAPVLTAAPFLLLLPHRDTVLAAEPEDRGDAHAS